MSATNLRTDDLIADLGRQLSPVRPLRPPIWRIAGWLLVSGAIAVPLAMQADLPAMWRQWMAAPDMWLSVVGSVLTALGAIAATFMVSLPDRSERWAWLPLPPLLLWIGAGGMGCLRPHLPGLPVISGFESAGDCLPFILGFSVPLAGVMFLMLRRVASLRPELTTLMAGLGIAATSASLLWLDHPFDAGAADLLAHAAAIAVVVVVLRLAGTPLLRIASEVDTPARR